MNMALNLEKNVKFAYESDDKKNYSSLRVIVK